MKAGDGNRTHVACLEGRYSTIELHPRFRPSPNPAREGPSQAATATQAVHFRIEPPCAKPRTVCFLPLRDCSRPGHSSSNNSKSTTPTRSNPIGTDMGGAGFEPAKALPPDLQSGPFGRLGIHPVFRHSFVVAFQSIPGALGGRCPETTRRIPLSGRAGGETRTHNPRFTKPKLCQLSYASDPGREIV